MSHVCVGMPGLHCASDGHGPQTDSLESRKSISAPFACGFRNRAISTHSAVTTTNPNTPAGSRNIQAVPAGTRPARASRGGPGPAQSERRRPITTAAASARHRPAQITADSPWSGPRDGCEQSRGSREACGNSEHAGRSKIHIQRQAAGRSGDRDPRCGALWLRRLFLSFLLGLCRLEFFQLLDRLFRKSPRRCSGR